jgi:uncharacterized protein YdaU (DUF1376 family)
VQRFKKRFSVSQPFMQLYVADYLGDTRHLTTEQHGAYLLLLMTMWRAGGRLPNEDKKLARITGCTSSRWAKIKAEVVGFFSVDGEEITHKRLMFELEKAQEKSIKRSVSGTQGGIAKSLKDKKAAAANASDLPCHSSEPESDSKKDKTTSYPKKTELFDDFWKAYPNKKAKPQALKAYAKALEKTDHATLVAAVHAQRGWRTWTDGFVPHPATWLNAERWTDEPESPRVAQRQSAGSSGRGDTSFADVIARRRREREQGVDVSGGQEAVSGDGCNWSEGAIEGVVTGSPSEGRSGHDLDFPF